VEEWYVCIHHLGDSRGYAKYFQGTLLCIFTQADEAAGFPSTAIPAANTFAAFAQKGYFTGLDYFVLYQDAQGKVNMIQRLDGPTPAWEAPRQIAAFDVADKGTGLACLTPNTNSQGGLDNDEIRLGSNMTRCYFQVNKAIREVLFKDNDFVEVGTVPTG
jgi:hypothetical protein